MSWPGYYVPRASSSSNRNLATLMESTNSVAMRVGGRRFGMHRMYSKVMAGSKGLMMMP
jgi:hypothetical protein